MYIYFKLAYVATQLSYTKLLLQLSAGSTASAYNQNIDKWLSATYEKFYYQIFNSQIILVFTKFLHCENLALYGTNINVYLSAIHSMHVATDQHMVFNQQLTPRLQQVLKGIQRIQAISNAPQIRRPIILDIMQTILNLLLQKDASYDNIMMWAACYTAFFGFL